MVELNLMESALQNVWFESGFYWVKFEDCVEWEVAWLQLDQDKKSVVARCTGGFAPGLRPVKLPQDEIGHKVEREEPVVIPETRKLAKDAEFLLSLIPAWARHSEPDMHPTMYGTGRYENDMAVVDRVNKIKSSVEVVLHGKPKEEG